MPLGVSTAHPMEKRRMHTRRTRLAVVVLAALALLATACEPAKTGPANMSENPVDNTPHVVDGEVVRFLQSGNTMYVGGTFSGVRNAGTSAVIPRSNFFAFDIPSGKVLPLTLDTDSSVAGIALSGQYLYLAGSFQTVNGASRRHVAKVDLTTGALDPGFKPAGVGAVATDLELVNGRLLVSGYFTKRVIALSPANGADTGYLNLSITGMVSSIAGPTRVYRFAVSPDGTRMVILGNFTSVHGAARRQAAMLHLGATTATVSSWYDLSWNRACASSVPHYTRDVDFSPDGKAFVIVTSGGHTQRDYLCDVAVKYHTNDHSDAVPAWVNYTSQDTLLGVEITGNSVYVGGHQRAVNVKVYQNGVLKHEEATAGPYSAPREGIAAIDYTTGYAQSWNPGRTRGVGARELYATSGGLWVGSDTDSFGGEYHARIAMVPRIAS